MLYGDGPVNRVPLKCCYKFKATVYWQSEKYAASFSPGLQAPCRFETESPCRSLSLCFYGDKSLPTCRLIGNLLQCVSICLLGLWAQLEGLWSWWFDGSLDSTSNVFSVEVTERWHSAHGILDILWYNDSWFFIFWVQLYPQNISRTPYMLKHKRVFSIFNHK